MLRITIALCSAFLFSSAFSQSYSSYVNPFIGTGGHGHTFPGPVLPFGMVQLSPDTRIDGSWDGCSGYHYSDSVIYGFSHTHLSGTGVSDWGDILIMPLTKPEFEPSKYASGFKHETEKASAGYYEVLLEREKIHAALTVTERVGIHQYTFPSSAEQYVLLDLVHRDKLIECNVKQWDSVTFVGYRISEGWAKRQQVFFAIRFSEKAKISKADGNIALQTDKAIFSFTNSSEKKLMVKVALSPVNFEGAIKNLNAEASHWGFQKYKDNAGAVWNTQLSRVEVKDSSHDKLSVFYTAMYHAFIHPSLNMDVDNSYLGRDGKIHTAVGYNNYHVFSLWDTYRALHPLFTILEPERNNDFLKCFLQQYKESQRLPMWELSSNETDCMIGFHSVSVLTDAILKGAADLDLPLAYEAMKAATNYSAYGIPEFNRKNYLQIEDESESVSKTLEYAYDNWCVAQVALKLGKKQDAAEFLKRSQAYKNLFDKQTGFMRPRKNGDWLKPFAAHEINNHFTEGNSWQYSFSVPHDIKELAVLHGGNQNLSKKLQELFSIAVKTTGREQADVTGLIGQYAHGNEPSHHIAYLHNFVERPDQTKMMVDWICLRFYKNAADGLIGNEDCGQMSAWYIFSSLGMYPVCPGSSQYILGSPQFSDIKINLPQGKVFTISKEKEGKLIDHLELNKQQRLYAYISHSVITAGGSLKFVYGDTVTEYGKGKYAPVTSVEDPDIIPAPVITHSAQVFRSEAVISIKAIDNKVYQVRYTTDGKLVSKNATPYKGPFIINKNCVIRTRLFTEKDSSSEAVARFYKLKNDYKIKIISASDPQYAAEGAQTLIDGIPSDADWRKGNWLGYQGKNFECVVDLLKSTDIDTLSLNCLQDTRSWIILPSTVSYYSSDDNQKFTLIKTITADVNADDYNVQMKNFNVQLPKNIKARYIKIVAVNYGKLPAWHAGAGGEAYIFTDELELR